MQSANLTASLVRSFFHSVRVRLVILVLVAVLPGVALTTRVLLEVFYLGHTEALYRDLIFMGIVDILALAAVWVVGDRLLKRPIDRLVIATKRIAAGDLSTRVGNSSGQGELSQLGEAFDSMAKSLEQSHSRLQALREIDQAILSALNLRGVLSILLEKIDLVLPYAASTVRLFNKRSGLLEPIACRNIQEAEWKHLLSPTGTRAWRVFGTKSPLTVRNVQTDPETRTPEFFRKQRLVSLLSVPLIAKDESLGVISFYTREEHEFSPEEVQLVNTIAGRAAIAIQNSQFYEQIEAYAEELRKTVGQLERANRVKDEFLSVMSHELRTPLNVVIGYSGMLKDGLLGELTPRQQEALAKIINRTNDQLLLVNNILFATVLETEGLKVDAHKVNVADVLNQLRSAYEAAIDKDVTLNWDYPDQLPVIETDSGKLGQILRNLIENAIKFTEKGSVTISARVVAASPLPRVSASVGEDSGTRGEGDTERSLELRVADTGVGIPHEAIPFIFDKFRQVDSSETRRYGGAGLGLYIVKKFTGLLGGTVEVETELGKGSTFTVKLPLVN